MSLKEEERDTLVNLYLGKCDETLNDARLTRDQRRWNASANRRIMHCSMPSQRCLSAMGFLYIPIMD